ncbi:hypothetical protein AOZ07_03360 [Glutamicibacter halophytocola]|uniref:hypothetical protein n=1 Tax=Glutamicibacter halophytocola TaxID=1933880 RepID=UPI0006D4C1EA|nr:hypothetical protein [Glutamicibacter halophytocola]ALG28127.1 hypothetical protein AOZ07_03360 [Glutamicibacter halophytocola]
MTIGLSESQPMTAAEARKLSGNTWLSRREAAKYLGIGEQTLANNKASGPKLYKAFGQVRHKLADLDLWMEQRLAS